MRCILSLLLFLLHLLPSSVDYLLILFYLSLFSLSTFLIQFVLLFFSVFTFLIRCWLLSLVLLYTYFPSIRSLLFLSFSYHILSSSWRIVTLVTDIPSISMPPVDCWQSFFFFLFIIILLLGFRLYETRYFPQYQYFISSSCRHFIRSIVNSYLHLSNINRYRKWNANVIYSRWYRRIMRERRKSYLYPDYIISLQSSLLVYYDRDRCRIYRTA